MAFLERGTKGAMTQRVNLSHQAYFVIENDMMAFCNRKEWSPFLNRIITNYTSRAQASISIALVRAEQEMAVCFSRLPPKRLQEAKDHCLSFLKYRLRTSQAPHPSGTSVKFRINTENFRYLTDPSSECHEDEHYQDKHKKPRLSLYLKALLEEYSELPMYQRERVYFLDRFSMAEQAVRESRLLKIQVASGTWYYVRPYSTELSTYHYITGISRPLADGGEAMAKNASFRIAGIQAMELTHRDGSLKPWEKESLQREIGRKGAQFLASDLSVVKVRLTPQGVRKYTNQLHLRPDYVEPPRDNVYCFHCTPIQIEYYFFKFGKDARILEPAGLARRFAQMYEEAAQNYRCTGSGETV